jgi:hypothetical protein
MVSKSFGLGTNLLIGEKGYEYVKGWKSNEILFRESECSA